MKKKIQDLSKGIFGSEDPSIELSVSEINLDVEYGQTCEGTVELHSRSGAEIRAMIFSSSRWMRCEETTVTGENVQIHYHFDSSAYSVDDICEGSIMIVSNGGELSLPFTVRICAPYCDCSLGRISDLDQFAALAREDWQEALAVFTSSRFESVFLRNKKGQRIYESLIRSHDKSLAMEEFLCAVRRKSPVTISVSQNLIEFQNLKGPVSERLVIEKSQWGHVRLKVRTEGAFLSVYKELITEEDFLGSFCQLEYRVRPAAARFCGGRIILESASQRIEIPVECRRDREQGEKELSRRRLQRCLLDYGKLHRDYLLGRMPQAEWFRKAAGEIDGCLNNSSNPIYHVMEADMLAEAGHADQAAFVLESVNGRELRYQSVVDYSYYLYVNARSRQEEQYTQYVRDTIRFYAEGQYQDKWELAVMLNHLEPRRQGSGQVMKQLRRLKELYSSGRHSYLYYLEAIRLLNLNPASVGEIGDFESSLFIWGARYDALSRDVVGRFADLTLRMHRFHPGYLQAMKKYCEKYESKPLLEAVVHMMVQGKCKSREDHEIYLLGVNSALRTQGLYEAFMDTLDLTEDKELPLAVLIYFQYDNHLPVAQRAFLYRYVVEHREGLEKLFDNYNGIIRAFTFEQLRAGRIDENLAELYSYYLKKESLTPHVIKSLPAVMFKQRLQVHGDITHLKRIIVSYAELEEEICEDLTDNQAIVDLYLDDYQILFEDAEGGRYMSTVDYTLSRMMDAGKYIRRCYEECPGDPRVLLNRSERALKYQMSDDTSIDVYKQTLGLGFVSRHYQKTVLKNLIDYYYDNYEGETLEKYLLQIDIRLLGAVERAHIIEYFIQRGLYEKAYRAVNEYGYENIQVKRIMRLASRTIRARNYEEQDFLTEMTYSAFASGRYDEVMLEYLVRYYNGPVENLYAVWKAARTFEVPAFALEERFLCSALFTESMIAEAGGVFTVYYGERPDMRIVRAFLALYSYRYLQGEEEAQPDLFRILEIELEQSGPAHDVCSLALIRYYAEDTAKSGEAHTGIYNETASFINRGILMPFFRKFSGTAQVPRALTDFTYLVYVTDPACNVSIRYVKNDADWNEAVEEPMQRAVGGIFVSSFRLFAGETLRYELTEKGDGVLHSAGSGLLKADETAGSADWVSRMIESERLGDRETLRDTIREYDRFDGAVEKLFSLR